MLSMSLVSEREPKRALPVTWSPSEAMAKVWCRRSWAQTHLFVVYYYSKYPGLCILKDKTASSVIISMKSIYAPDEGVTGNMPFLSNGVHKFTREWRFQVSTSSSRYTQSSGMSERGIRTIKNFSFKKAWEDWNDPCMHSSPGIQKRTYLWPRGAASSALNESHVEVQIAYNRVSIETSSGWQPATEAATSKW